jgi:fused signal recognition particle receptor
MFNLFKNNSLEEKQEKTGWLTRLKTSLHKTRRHFSQGLSNLILGRKVIDQTLLKEIETFLIASDVGTSVTHDTIAALTASVKRNQLADTTVLWQQLQQQLLQILEACESSIEIQQRPYVILVLGINGVGKTTTIGKLTRFFTQLQKRVLLAAGDTFRAAAIEQLEVWAQRNQAPMISQHQGADSASVIYDAVVAAKARDFDILIADTAGRLHNKGHLMQELQKIKRVLQRIDPNMPHEVLLILDATTGQNALIQAEQFHKMIQVDGIVLTKLDGTAKGGIIFEIAKKLRIPIRFIGIGEGLDDLRPFKAKEFIDALFEKD